MSLGAIYRRDEFTPAIAGQSIVIAPAELSQYRPSYRNLSWSLAKGGYEVNNDLPGEDRPETVTAILEDVFGWAGMPVPD